MAVIKQILGELRPYITRYTVVGAVLVAVALAAVVTGFLWQPDQERLQKQPVPR